MFGDRNKFEAEIFFKKIGKNLKVFPFVKNIFNES